MREYTAGNILQQFNFGNINNWREILTEIKSGANDISFIDTMPNVFIIQNTSQNELKISLSGVANTNNYEFKVSANTTKPIGSPIPKSQISIYNETTNTFTLRIFAVSAPLDLSIFNETNVKIDGAQVSTDGILRGFETGLMLPSGTNTIGAVDLVADVKTNIESLKSNILNLVSGANLASLLTELQTLNTFISSLISADIVEGKINLKEILNAVSNKNTYCESVETTVTTSNPISITKNIIRIAYISNDGTSDITATLTTDDGTKVFTIKAGEVLSDIKCFSTHLELTGITDTAVRVAVEYEI